MRPPSGPAHSGNEQRQAMHMPEWRGNERGFGDEGGSGVAEH